MDKPRSTKSVLRFVQLLAVLVCAGCSVGPDYEKPIMEVPSAFNQVAQVPEVGGKFQREPVSEQSTLDSWWHNLGDPILVKLIEEATASNLDLRLAAARVREARALLLASRAPFVPSINTYGKYSRSRSSENAPGVIGTNGTGTGTTGVGASNTGGTATSESISGRVNSLYEAGFDASWEIDIFGGTRREVEAAADIYQASIEARRDTLVTLLSEVAKNYVSLRGAQNLLAITRQNAAVQRETLDLQGLRLEAGITSDLTVAQAESQLRLTESRIPVLETPVREALNRLSILVDKYPGALVEELNAIQPVPRGPAIIRVGVPSEVLQHRPDVRQAENVLAASTANIGVAVADFFPKLVLDGTLGLRSREAGSLGDAGSKFWSFGPTINWGILNFYSVLANIEIQSARQEQALIQYRQVVLASLEEADNAIAAYQREQEQNLLLQRSVESSKRTLRLATELNEAGVENFLNVLTAQQAVFDSESNLAQSDQSLSNSLIALYKALGGGWEVGEDVARSL